MDKHKGLRLRVVKALDQRVGGLRKLADELKNEDGLSYDTLLRIKNEEGDPGYSKIVRLAVRLGLLSEQAADPVPEKTAAPTEIS